MNIKIIKEDGLPVHLAEVGGECAACNLELSVDQSLPIRTQRILVIHAVIENYNRGMSHSKVEQLTGFIEDALDKLEEI